MQDIYISYVAQEKDYYGYFYKPSMTNLIQFDSISVSNFVQLKLCENEYLSAEKVEEMNKQWIFSVMLVGDIWLECFCWSFVIGWKEEMNLID